MTDEIQKNDSHWQQAKQLDDSSSKSFRGTDSSERLSTSGYFAWFTVIVVTIGMMVLTAVASKLIDKQKVQEASAVDLLPIEMQGKMLMTQQSLQPPSKKDVEHEKTESPAIVVPSELDVGLYEQRLCYTILINEFNGAEKALEHLQTTDKRVDAANFQLTENQESLRNSIATPIGAN